MNSVTRKNLNIHGMWVELKAEFYNNVRDFLPPLDSLADKNQRYKSGKAAAERYYEFRRSGGRPMLAEIMVMLIVPGDAVLDDYRRGFLDRYSILMIRE